jgi:hypothetical protein
MSGAIIRAVSPLLPLAAGLIALVAGVLVLRTYGPRYRVGRLLATTPDVTVAQARGMAAGPPHYVRVQGRIDAEGEFEDEHHRPLVFRRTQFQLQRNRRWETFEDDRKRVPFEIREGLDSIAIDDAALDAGLVVIPRESVGTAADIGDRVPAGTAPSTPARLWIEQVSSVEHAIAAGVPVLDAQGTPRLTAGLGRPLVMTTLEPTEAMRVLGEGNRTRPLVAVLCLAAGFVLITIGIVIAVAGVVVS